MIFSRLSFLLVAMVLLNASSADDARERPRRSTGRTARVSARARRCAGRRTPPRDPLDKPNFVIFFADDMGYGDLASYGHPVQERGPIDDVMVENGIKFTQGYVPDTVCSPSRAALLTGRYPVRSGVYSPPDGSRVFLPWTRTGLPASEVTIPEVLKEEGYISGMAGKWHLGLNSETNCDGAHLPFRHGFEFVGHFLPFTNSMGCDETGNIQDFPDTSKCFLYKRDQIVAQPFNHTYLTKTFVNDATTFIEYNAHRPFFFYFPFSHPHAPLYASPEFAGKSRRGDYGDNINEMSAAVGEVIDTLEAQGILNNTLVLFISDHGPQPEYCAQGGDPSIFKGYKTNTWEGGVRVPFVAYWPGQITPRESNELVSTLDIMKTLVDLAGGSLPSNVSYDGEVITDVLLNNALSPHDVLYYYCKDRLMAVRSGPYKVHYFTHRVQPQDYFTAQCGDGGQPTRHYFDCYDCYDSCVTEQNPPIVYNVEHDPIEAFPLNVTADPALGEFMADLQEKVAAHVASVVVAEPLLDDKDPTKSIVPCCNEATNCICNYGPVTGPYN
nr:arylsulfatase-like [Lytechinus pictus]